MWMKVYRAAVAWTCEEKRRGVRVWQRCKLFVEGGLLLLCFFRSDRQKIQKIASDVAKYTGVFFPRQRLTN
jgi:hypothetical protein